MRTRAQPRTLTSTLWPIFSPDSLGYPMLYTDVAKRMGLAK